MLGKQHLLPAHGGDDPQGEALRGETQADDQLLSVGSSHPNVPGCHGIHSLSSLEVP